MVLPRLTHAARAVAVAVLAVGGCATLSGCVPTACPADLIVDHFTLTATSGTHPDPSLAICSHGTCSSAVGKAQGGTAFTAGSPRLSLFFQKAGSWTVAVVDGKRPSEVTVRLYDGRTPLATRTVALSWHRGDPQDTCHDWRTTDDVHVAVP